MEINTQNCHSLRARERRPDCIDLCHIRCREDLLIPDIGRPDGIAITRMAPEEWTAGIRIMK